MHLQIVSMSSHAKSRTQQLPHQCAWSISDFLVGETLGQGLYGKVVRARFKHEDRCGSNDLDVAIKVVDKHTVMRHSTSENVMRERKILSSFRETSAADFVVRLHLSFMSKDALFFVMELCDGGDLTGLTKRAHAAIPRGVLTENAWEWAKQCSALILRALECVHKAGVVHRDLTPSNIMLKADGSIRIIDFGSASLILQDPSPAEEKSNVSSRGPRALDNDSFVGTADFVAPEVIRGDGGMPSFTIDLWSYGCILSSLFDPDGRSPFSSSSGDESMQSILNHANGSVTAVFPSCMPPTATDLALSLLNPVPSDRRGADECTFAGRFVGSSGKRKEGTQFCYSSLRRHTFFGSVKWSDFEGSSLLPSPLAHLLPRDACGGLTLTDGASLNLMELLS